MDLVIPRAQWLLIHPEDGGYLCANCMVARAENLSGAVNITGVVTFKGDYTKNDHPYWMASELVALRAEVARLTAQVRMRAKLVRQQRR